jgi:hypothetical protein
MSEDGGVVIPFTLSTNESNQLLLTYAIATVNAPNKLRGTLLYTKEVSIVHYIIFKIINCRRKTVQHLTSSTFPYVYHVSPSAIRLQSASKSESIHFETDKQINRDSFADLLSTGDLSSKQTLTISTNDSLQTLLHRLQTHAHVTVVESLSNGTTASLYTQTIQHHAVCVLIKVNVCCLFVFYLQVIIQSCNI